MSTGIIELKSGGAQMALTTTEAVLDLGPLQGCEVAIFCSEQDIWFCATTVSTGGALVTTGAQAASLTALVADGLQAGDKALRRVGRDQYLVAKTVAGAGTLKVKVVSKPLTGL